MIKHVVLFKFRDASEGGKREQLEAIKSALEGLMGKVETLRSIRVGLNCNEGEEYDLCLETTHDDMAGLKAYATHEKHVAVSRELIRPILEARACVDYEM